jgi:hypothetical protein
MALWAIRLVRLLLLLLLLLLHTDATLRLCKIIIIKSAASRKGGNVVGWKRSYSHGTNNLEETKK